MKKILLICLISISPVFSQSNFWEHYSLDTTVRDLINYDDSVLYAVRDIDILKSTNMGTDWDTIYTTPYPCSAWTILDFFQRRITNGQVYMIVRQRNGSSGCTNVPVCISTNSGQNWQDLNLPNRYFGDIDITSNGTLVLVSDTTYYSTNMGSSWNYLNIPNDGTLKQKIEVDTDDYLYVVRENKYWYEPAWIWFRSEYLYKSTDFGQNWEFLFNTIYEPNAYFSTLFHTENNEVIASQSVPSKTWYYKENSLSNFPLYDISSAFVLNSKLFFASPSCCINQGINYSSNSGQTWVSKNSGLSNLNTYSLIIDSLGYLYAGTGNGIFKSNLSIFPLSSSQMLEFNDTRIGDTTYKEIKLINPFPFDLTIDSLKCLSSSFFISGINNTVIQANDSTIIEVGFSPTDFGENSSDIFIYTNYVVDRILAFGLSPFPTLVRLVHPMFSPTIIGDTSSAYISFVNESINQLIIDTVYLKKGIDFYLEIIQFPNQINLTDTLDLKIYFSPMSIGSKVDTLVVLSNATNSPFYERISGIGKNPTSVDNDNLEIKEYSLSDCYPNPFNPSTTIEFAVPKRSNVRVSVFNLLGEEMDILVNEEKGQGKYQLEFNGKNLSSGVYFYKMQAENFVVTKKFVLLK